MLSILGARRRYLCVRLSVFLGALASGMPAGTGAPAGAQTAPLAYVRTVIVSPAQELCPPLAPLAPPLTGARAKEAARKAAAAQYAARVHDRDRFILLRSQAATSLSAELATAIGRLGGIRVQPGTAGGVALAAREANGIVSVNGRAAAGDARNAGVDGAVVTVLDRFGAHTDLQREVWLRGVVYAVRGSGSVAGPFHAVGVARAPRMLIRPGFTRTDAQLVREAASQAAHLLATALETGRDAPFSDDTRVAVVPAVTPESVQRESEAGGAGDSIPLPALGRQSDVLLQPDLPPIVTRIDAAEVYSALSLMDKTPAALWTGTGPDTAVVSALAMHIGAQYVFLSRVTRVTLDDSPVDVRDGYMVRIGIERNVEAEAEAVLVRAADGRVLWRDRLQSRTASRTAYARGRARIRTPAKCVLDAVHAAYGYLRLSFEDYRRRGER
jgi:hypothetical protein